MLCDTVTGSHGRALPSPDNVRNVADDARLVLHIVLLFSSAHHVLYSRRRSRPRPQAGSAQAQIWSVSRPPRIHRLSYPTSVAVLRNVVVRR